ncbi:MAG: iron ABC transporter substrate-binding protein [Euryarchaeota archaeon]|nr:iron ABC transporter substrate-binding protein [Euryarchaeota archaeon]
MSGTEVLLACAVMLCILVLCAGCTDREERERNSEIPGPSIKEIEQSAIDRTKYPITDALGRTVFIPNEIHSVICSGAGCLRYIAYLNATDMVVGIDTFEQNTHPTAAVPYLLANPELHSLPVFGNWYGADDPTAIRELDPQPNIIFKMVDDDMSPARIQMLQDLTGVPVIALKYGDLTAHKNDMNYALRVMGVILNKKDRAEELILLIDRTTGTLHNRASLIGTDGRKTAYIGGIYNKGPRGLFSTDPEYEPFVLAGVVNVAVPEHPDAIFVDLSTLLLKENAVTELLSQNNADRSMMRGKAYGVLPYEWYETDYASGLANAFFIGKVLYPERFSDIDPEEMAEYMYSIFYGVPLFDKMNVWLEKRTFQMI